MEKGIGRKERLATKRIDTFQKFYGAAICSNKGSSKAMLKATQAILKHYSSSPKNPKHENCPEGGTYWCSYNRDRATGQNTHEPIKNPFPQAVVEKIQSLFNELGNENFLATCEKCKTQNINEAYHNVVWMLAPISQYNFYYETQFAVYLATLLFNHGTYEIFQNVCKESNISVLTSMINQWKLIDHVGVCNKKCKTLRDFNI